LARRTTSATLPPIPRAEVACAACRFASARWKVAQIVGAGNVFAIERGAEVPGYGGACLEEDVSATHTGMDWLSMPQTELWILPASG